MPDPPAAAAGVFGAGLDAAAAYAALLATEGVTRGLLGPREVPRIWDRHLLNCAVVARLIPPGVEVIDVGSGAGLPGIPLAIARPDLSVTLLEPLLRRATFLEETVARLGLDRVSVVRDRAEDYADRADADVVTARAVAPLARLAGWCAPLLRPDGILLALKGASATEEVAASRTVLARLGLVDVEVALVGAGVVDPPTTVVRAVLRGRAARRPRKG